MIRSGEGREEDTEAERNPVGKAAGANAEGEKEPEDLAPEGTGEDTESGMEELSGAAQEDFGEKVQEDFGINWEGMSWYEGYQVLLEHPALVDDYGVSYGGFEYLKFYFGEENCKFDSYWLCDVDGNEVPELFLVSDEMGLTAVFTYNEEPVFLLVDNIYGINPETGEVVIQGHWHGAGGTWINEWSAYEIGGDGAEWSMYIDCWLFPDGEGREKPYAVYLPKEGIEEWEMEDGELYHEIYAAHVEPCVLIENYAVYDNSDRSGLDRIQSNTPPQAAGHQI